MKNVLWILLAIIGISSNFVAKGRAMNRHDIINDIVSYRNDYFEFRKLTTPLSITRYLSKFKYQYDEVYKLQLFGLEVSYPLEPGIKNVGQFVKDQKGDCKDFAWFTFTIATLNGLPSKICTIYPPKGVGHAFCLIKYNNKIYSFCNATTIGKTKPTSFKTKEALLEYYRKLFNWSKIDTEYEVYLETFNRYNFKTRTNEIEFNF